MISMANEFREFAAKPIQCFGEGETDNRRVATPSKQGTPKIEVLRCHISDRMIPFTNKTNHQDHCHFEEKIPHVSSIANRPKI